MLPRVRELVSIARQLDKAAHLATKHSHAAKARRELAKEMDLPTDSDDDDEEDGRGDEAARREAKRKEQQTAKLKAQLKRGLARLERPKDVPVHVAAKSTGAWS